MVLMCVNVYVCVLEQNVFGNYLIICKKIGPLIKELRKENLYILLLSAACHMPVKLVCLFACLFLCSAGCFVCELLPWHAKCPQRLSLRTWLLSRCSTASIAQQQQSSQTARILNVRAISQ